jgi:hypothetical protein
MRETRSVIREMYAAFNRRDMDGVLAQMSESVDWPASSEGGRVVGKEAIRAYWTRQWTEFDPRVEPLEVVELAEGRIEVRVHQLVRNLQGEVISDQEVWHVYTVADGLIARMEIREETPSFGKRK